MLTVMELLSFPLFRNFRLASGYGGLYNQVSGTGIFEWESSYEVEKTFEQGEFVVTTLSLARSDTALAESSIRMLINKKVSAIAIKDVYFRDISDELRAYSDAKRVPIFFFSDIFFDDIIYTVKNTLLTQRRDFNRDEQVEFLLETAHTPDQKKRKAKEINPFFHSSLICCFCAGKKSGQRQSAPETPQLNPEEAVYSIIDYQQGFLVIYTMKDSVSGKDVSGKSAGGSGAKEDILSFLEDRMISFLDRSGLNGSLNSIGISRPARGLENLGTAIQECLYACFSCRLNQVELLRFVDSGLDQILLPMLNNAWTKSYYDRLLSRLTAYDAQHESKLMETLREYVRNDGDIKLTAQRLFQHSNTIRYRIGKIKNLLGLSGDATAFAQLYIFMRLHEIFQNTDTF